MSVVTVTEAQLPTLLRWHAEGTGRAIVRGVRKSLQKAKRHLVSVTPKDKGAARRGWKVKTAGTPTEVTSRFQGLIGAIENDSPIIGILEEGARPHPVSLEGQEAIYQWVLRHMRLVGNTTTGFAAVHASEPAKGTRTRRFGSVDQGEQLARRITYLICRKIRTKGQAPKYFVRDSMELIAHMCQVDVEAAIRERMSRAGGWKAIPTP